MLLLRSCLCLLHFSIVIVSVMGLFARFLLHFFAPSFLSEMVLPGVLQPSSILKNEENIIRRIHLDVVDGLNRFARHRIHAQHLRNHRQQNGFRNLLGGLAEPFAEAVKVLQIHTGAA